jgi:hypothetical protein
MRVRCKKRKGLRLIDGGFEDLMEEFREALMEFVMYSGAKQEKAKQKLFSIDSRLSRKAELRLVASQETSEQGRT